MKVLNLDSLAKPRKAITINGVRHVVKDMTVEDFIEVARAAEKYESEDASISLLERFNESLNGVKRALPTITDEEIKKLNVDQLGAINKFIRDELIEDSEVQEVQEEEEGKQ
ncbi:hypothetical protein [Methyloversatilis sp.]|uniref:hypothetical protein n=1 Tax=Methyloversatilis sp. TaxID=2569862 RepID=UPI0035B19421